MSDKPLRPYQIKLMLLQSEYDDLESEHRHLLQNMMIDMVASHLSEITPGNSWKGRSNEIVARQAAIKAEVLKLDPAPQVLGALGEDFYFKYQERYPINRNTKLIRGNFPYRVMKIPKPFQAVAYPGEVSPFPSPIDLQAYTIEFEEWSDGRGWYEYLAYLPETNTVYQSTKRPAR